MGLAWYGCSLALELDRSARDARLVLRVLTVSTLGSSALKLVIQDERPDGDPYGAPSGHATLSAAFAAAMDGLHGHGVGIPLHALSVIVGSQRIDRRRHDLDDVLPGWVLGAVIGHTLSSRASTGGAEISMAPYLDPELGVAGVQLVLRR